MKLYLDLNCFNRPFDDQSQRRIAIETACIWQVLEGIVQGEFQLVWSFVLEFENAHHPIAERRNEIGHWKQWAVEYVGGSSQGLLLSKAQALIFAAGMKPIDALHVAAAEQAGCYYFASCDDRLLAACRRTDLALLAVNPCELLEDLKNAGTTSGS